MIPIHELFNRIRWDPEFARGSFQLGYYERAQNRVVVVPLKEVIFPPESPQTFQLVDTGADAFSTRTGGAHHRKAITSSATCACGPMQTLVFIRCWHSWSNDLPNTLIEQKNHHLDYGEDSDNEKNYRTYSFR